MEPLNRVPNPHILLHATTSWNSIQAPEASGRCLGMGPWRAQGPAGPSNMKAPGLIQRCLGMDPLKDPGPTWANACRAIVKLCLANLSAKSHFGSFAELQNQFLEEVRGLRHLEALKRAYFEGDPRNPKWCAVRGYTLLTTVRGCGASRRLRVCLCSCPARLDPSRPSDP